MNVLFVNACMREGSRTLTLCREYLKKNIPESSEVHELTLRDEKLIPLSAELLERRTADIEAGDYSDVKYDYARDFAAADLILIGAPLWDCSFPSILKIYFENICVNGLTFGYGEKGKPRRLCKADKLVYITTAGGYMSEPNSAELYMRELCGMFAIPDFRFISADGLDIFGNSADDILNNAKMKL